MDDPETIIARLGGTSVVALALGIPISTVSSWKRAGRIPAWRRPALDALAARAAGENRTTGADRAIDDCVDSTSRHGAAGDISGAAIEETRIVLCDPCGRRVDDAVRLDCTCPDCPHAVRPAA